MKKLISYYKKVGKLIKNKSDGITSQNIEYEMLIILDISLELE